MQNQAVVARVNYDATLLIVAFVQRNCLMATTTCSVLTTMTHEVLPHCCNGTQLTTRLGQTWSCTPEGRTVIETFNKNTMAGEFVKSGWRLIEHNGHVLQFDTIEELTKHFFDRLNVSGRMKYACFVVDRSRG